MYISYLPLAIYFFIMDACPGHILERTKGIEFKLGTYIDVNERSLVDKNHNPTLHYTWVISPYFFFIKGCFLCHVLVYKWCWITSSAFNRHSSFREHSSLPVILLFLLRKQHIDICIYKTETQQRRRLAHFEMPIISCTVTVSYLISFILMFMFDVWLDC